MSMTNNNEMVAKIRNAARAGKAHANLESAKADPIKWLADPDLEVIFDAEGIDSTSPEEWDAYCAAFYLARTRSDLRVWIVLAADTNH